MQPMPPCPAPACWWQMQVSGLLLYWQLWLGVYSVGFFFFSSPCYVALWDSKTPHRPSGERVSWCLETSFKTPSLGQFSVPNSFVSIFISYILSYLLSKTMGCLSGCLVSSASIQKLFCGICSAFKWSFHEFLGEKVSPCPIPPSS